MRRRNREETVVAQPVPQFEWQRVDLRAVTPDPAAVGLLTEALARELVAIPLSVGESGVVVAVAEPEAAVLRRLQQAVNRRLDVRIATRSDILHVIGFSYRALSGVGDAVRVFE